MKIYTKSGDQGETALWGGGRVKKSHPRVATYGTLDEANSMIGLAISYLKDQTLDLSKTRLIRIQNELFQAGSELASSGNTKSSWRLVDQAEITMLENEIDEMESSLESLKNFILPGGTTSGASLHLARTIVRRAERECVDLIQTESLRPELIQYLNRLSDYLFVMARFVNHKMREPETIWVAPKN